MTSPSRTHFMHILNLDTLGGVETLYVNFLKYVWVHEPSLSITSVSGKKIHPWYLDIMDKMRYKPFHERYVLGMKMPKFLRFATNMRRWLLKEISSADVCIYWNRIETVEAPGPFVYYEHGASWNYKETKPHKKFWDRCSQVICVSEASREMLRQKTTLTCPLSVLPNPIRPDIRIASQPKRHPQGKLRLGFIGRLLPLKAPGIAIYTLHELRQSLHIDAHLTIAGVGKEKPFLEKLVHSLNEQNNITFVNAIDDLEHFYDSIDILIMPSIREPQGLVSMEASARGVPVVATCVDGLYESVLDNKSGLLVVPKEPIRIGQFISKLDGLPEVVFDPIHKTLVQPCIGAPYDFAQAVERLVSIPGLYEQLSQGGIDHARNRLDFPSWCTSLINMLMSSVSIQEQETE